MHSGPLHVLHDPWNQDPFPVADRVDLALLPFHVTVNEDRFVGGEFGSRSQVPDELRGVLDDLPLPARPTHSWAAPLRDTRCFG